MKQFQRIYHIINFVFIELLRLVESRAAGSVHPISLSDAREVSLYGTIQLNLHPSSYIFWVEHPIWRIPIIVSILSRVVNRTLRMVATICCFWGNHPIIKSHRKIPRNAVIKYPFQTIECLRTRTSSNHYSQQHWVMRWVYQSLWCTDNWLFFLKLYVCFPQDFRGTTWAPYAGN
jgi:hypothetical protein